jgi:ribose 5-phosphate isomerase B
MSKETIAIASDHAGFELKKLISHEIEALGFELVDLGTDGPESVDYPDYGDAVAHALGDGRASRGILICGTGIGVSIAANRHSGVRAALCHDTVTARLSREHNDANVMALGARVIGEEVAKDCVRIFLTTEYAGGRHDRRVAKLS